MMLGAVTGCELFDLHTQCQRADLGSRNCSFHIRIEPSGVVQEVIAAQGSPIESRLTGGCEWPVSPSTDNHIP